MPLVRIDTIKGHNGRGDDFGERVGDLVYESMMATINVPVHDNFRIATAHEAGGLTFDAGYLGIARTPGIVMIQIVLNTGRTVEMKKALYAMIAERLYAELGVRKEDVFVSLVEVAKENWSFGNGIAQYA